MYVYRLEDNVAAGKYAAAMKYTHISDRDYHHPGQRYHNGYCTSLPLVQEDSGNEPVAAVMPRTYVPVIVFNNITGRRDIIPVCFYCPAIIMNQTLRTQIIQPTDNTIVRFFQSDVIFNRFNPAHLYRRLKINGKGKMSIKRIAPDITCRYADTGCWLMILAASEMVTHADTTE